MAATETTTLQLSARTPEGSRSARRLRRSGLIPGVIYGIGEDPAAFSVDARILRNTLAHSGAVIEVSLDGGTGQPVLVKDIQRHPVRGDAVHVDFLRVNMDETIHATTTVDLVGADEAPGVVQGGVLSQGLVVLNIEALPGDLPETIQVDVSGLELMATLTLADITPPQGVTLLDDPETVLVTITPPTAEEAPEEEIETETALVSEEAKAEGDTGDEAAQKAEASDSEES